MKLLYHHCRSLESVVFQEVLANPEFSCPQFKPAYSWLEQEVGFYPLFLAVGTAEPDLGITGYPAQFSRILTETISAVSANSMRSVKTYRAKGEFPNNVLFSFSEVQGVFMDYEEWCCIMGSVLNGFSVSKQERQYLFKNSWPRSRWLRKVEDEPGSVQLVCESLDLPSAERIWVRNRKTAVILSTMGFSNVEVQRISASSALYLFIPIMIIFLQIFG